MIRRAVSVKASLGAFFVALISTLSLEVSTAWANDLEVIREGLLSVSYTHLTLPTKA